MYVKVQVNTQLQCQKYLSLYLTHTDFKVNLKKTASFFKHPTVTLKLCVKRPDVSCDDQALMGSYTPSSGLLIMLQTAPLYIVPTLVSFKPVFLSVVEKRFLPIQFLVFYFFSVQNYPLLPLNLIQRNFALLGQFLIAQHLAESRQVQHM